MSQCHQKIPGSSILNEHINQNIKECDDYLMSNKISILFDYMTYMCHSI